MASPSTTTTTNTLNLDEWELVNDQNFVYYRKRRRLDPTQLARPEDPALDPAAEAKRRRARKRNALLKVRDKYAKELAQWEILSNSLQALKEKAEGMQGKEGGDDEMGGEEERERSGLGLDRESSALWVLELVAMVEAQEAIIQDLSHLCDVAESFCDTEEDKIKQSLLDLPVWDSPQELMASLCED